VVGREIIMRTIIDLKSRASTADKGRARIRTSRKIRGGTMSDIRTSINKVKDHRGTINTVRTRTRGRGRGTTSIRTRIRTNTRVKANMTLGAEATERGDTIKPNITKVSHPVVRPN
jgi:hypothetical protein